VHGVGRKRLEHALVALAREQPLVDRVERLGAQRVVGDDHLVGHAEHAEEDRGEDPGAVLARSAVVDRRRLALRERLHHAGDGIARVLGEPAVAVREEHRLVEGRRRPRVEAVHERQMVEADRERLERTAALGVELLRRAEVDDGADAQLVADARHVSRRQQVERVAAKEEPAPQRPPVGSGIAAEIAEVEAAFELDAARGRGQHERSLAGASRGSGRESGKSEAFRHPRRNPDSVAGSPAMRVWCSTRGKPGS
jgi:hypothetical protein